MRLTRSLAASLAASLALATPGVVVVNPSGYTYNYGFDVYRYEDVVGTGLEHARLRVSTSQDLYVDQATGLNTNPGTNPLLPKKAVWSALNVAGSKTVYVKAGTYSVADSWSGGGGGTSLVADTNVIAVEGLDAIGLTRPGVVRSTVHAVVTWTSVGGGTPNTYSASWATASPYAVIDEAVPMADGGHGTRMTVRSSIATVDANPGSYWWDSGTSTLYVRTADSRAPDASVLPLRTTLINGRASVAGVSFYVRGVEFIGGRRPFLLQASTTAAFVDCAFMYGQDFEGLSCSATTTSWCIGCTANGNTGDGFTYNSTTNVVEIDCIGIDNGYNGANINNGSSTHNGANVIRIGCIYIRNEGPNIADVGGGKSLNIGLTLRSTKASANRSNAYCGDVGTMWLDSCSFNDNVADLATDNAGGVIKVRNSSPVLASLIQTGPGTVVAYAA